MLRLNLVLNVCCCVKYKPELWQSSVQGIFPPLTPGEIPSLLSYPSSHLLVAMWPSDMQTTLLQFPQTWIQELTITDFTVAKACAPAYVQGVLSQDPFAPNSRYLFLFVITLCTAPQLSVMIVLTTWKYLELMSTDVAVSPPAHWAI